MLVLTNGVTDFAATLSVSVSQLIGKKRKKLWLISFSNLKIHI